LGKMREYVSDLPVWHDVLIFQIESLTNLLQERCGSFCQPGDIDLYKVS
jgi:hypothetical protein